MFLSLSSVSSVFLFFSSLFFFMIFLFLIFTGEALLIDWSILELSSCSINMTLVVDSISMSFSGVVCLISACVMVFTSSYMSHDKFLSRFVWLVLLFVLSMNFFILIPSLPALLLGWDGLGIVSFVLVIYYQNFKSLNAGILTIMANRIGDVAILISISMLVFQGHWNIMFIFSSGMVFYILLLILVAGMTKSAQIPFSAWLPAAMAAPTPVSALVHSSTLVTAGVFLLIRFYDSFSKFQVIFHILFFISVLTMFLAGIGANYENDLKKVIALSTLSQLGVMMMSLAMKMPYLTLFHLYTHALFKALLFLCAGAIIHASLDNQDIRFMGGLYSELPLVIICMNIANLCLCGSPFLSGFYSKDLILEFSLFSNFSWLMVFLVFLATWMTTSYSLRLSFCSLWSNWKSKVLHTKHSNDTYINIAISILAFSAITAGVFFQILSMDFQPFTLLPSLLKMLPLVLFISAIIFTFIFWYFQMNEYIVSKLRSFLTSMWFLAQVSSQPVVGLFLPSTNKLTSSLDYGWLEIFSGRGAFNFLKILTNMNEKLQLKKINFFILVFIFLLIILILFLMWV